MNEYASSFYTARFTKICLVFQFVTGKELFLSNRTVEEGVRKKEFLMKVPRNTKRKSYMC